MHDKNKSHNKKILHVDIIFKKPKVSVDNLKRNRRERT